LIRNFFVHRLRIFLFNDNLAAGDSLNDANLSRHVERS